MAITTPHVVDAIGPGPAKTEPDVGTLLGVWAHPDDEAFLSAGLMARARRSGRRVVVATATRGEHGTNDPRDWPPDLLGSVRERELSASLAAVDVKEHHWLGHRDGDLARQAPGPGAAKVAELIELVRPQTIIPFGPDGMTGHPDHRAVFGWVHRAWRLTGRRARLWYATVTPAFHTTWGHLNDEIGLWSRVVDRLSRRTPIWPRAWSAKDRCSRRSTRRCGRTPHRRTRSSSSWVSSASGAGGPRRPLSPRRLQSNHVRR